MADDGTIKKDQIIDPEAKAAIDEVTNSIRILLDQFTAFTNTINTSTKAISEQTKSISDLGKIQKETEDQTKKLETLKNKLAASEAKLTEEYVKANMTKKEYAERLKQETILHNENSGTLEKLTAQNRLLNAEKKKLNLETQEGTKRLKEINAELNKNAEQAEKAASGDEKRRLGIGKYKEAITGVLGKLAIFGIAFEAGKKAIDFFANSSEAMSDRIKISLSGVSGAFSIMKGELATALLEIDDKTKATSMSTEHWYSKWMAVGAGILNVSKWGKGFSNYVQGLAHRMDVASNAMQLYTEKMIELEKAEIKLIEPRAKANEQIKKARELMMDENLSIDQKIKFTKQVYDLEEKTTKQELEDQAEKIKNVKLLQIVPIG